MLTIVHSGWNTISYDTQREITRDFVSDQTRDEYLQFLITPAMQLRLKCHALVN